MIPASGATPEAAVLQPEDIGLLTEVGFLAAGAGDLARADRIFLALADARPARAFPWLGRAVARLNAGRANEAVALLDQVRGLVPAEQMVCEVWRGFALKVAGRQGASRQVLRAALAQGVALGPQADLPALRLAEALLADSPSDPA